MRLPLFSLIVPYTDNEVSITRQMAKRVSVFMCVAQTGMTMTTRGGLTVPAAFLTGRTVLVDDAAQAGDAASAALRSAMPDLSPSAVITIEDQRELSPSEQDCVMGKAFFPDDTQDDA